MLTIDAWLEAARADAERRNLPELEPLLEALARSTDALRRADAALHPEDPVLAPAPEEHT